MQHTPIGTPPASQTQSSGCGKFFNVIVLLGCGTVIGVVLCAVIFLVVAMNVVEDSDGGAPIATRTRVVAVATPLPDPTSTRAGLGVSSATATPEVQVLPEEEEEEVAPTIHVVVAGDTLGKIAAQYGTTVEAIVAANGMDDPNALRVGQELLIPSSIVTTTEPTPTAQVETENVLSPINELTQAVREVTDDSSASVELEDGFLSIVYSIPENFEVFYLGTWRTQLRMLMPHLARTSQGLDYTEVEITARGIVGGRNAIIGFAAYDKFTVENVTWEDLTNDVIVGLAIRYNTHSDLE